MWKNMANEVYVRFWGQEDFDRYSAEQYEPIPETTLISRAKLRAQTAVLQGIFAVSGLRTGIRPSHKLGAGLLGTATVNPDPAFPEHPFFKAGRTFPVRLRHSNLSPSDGWDDAGLSFRGAALKFADVDHGGPLDLVMNSGLRSFFWNGKTLFGISRYPPRSQGKTLEGRKQFFRTHPALPYGLFHCIRRAPESYSLVSYATKFALHFRALDGKTRFVRFRLVPISDWERVADDSGLTEEATENRLETRMYHTPWDIEARRDPEDKRPSDYLHTELGERIARDGAVRYRLQIQLWESNEQDEPWRVFNPGFPWELPWLDLAELEMTQELAPEVTERMRFIPSNVPDSLGQIEVGSEVDPNSILYIRKRAYAWSQASRLFRRKIKGGN